MSTANSRTNSKASADNNNNTSNSRPVSEASNRGESRASSRESYSRSESRSSPRKSRANKIYRCPPTPEPEYFLEREKSYVLDNVAVSSVERENNLQNPKVGTVIPPYNSHYDRHPRAYFKFACVDKLLQTTQQEKGKGDTSTMGPLVDKHWNEGRGARYIKLRNFEFGCGKSWDERAGPGRFVTGPRTSFYVGDPDAAFGRHFVSPYAEPVSRSSSRAGLGSREGATRNNTARPDSVASNTRSSAYSSASSGRPRTQTTRESTRGNTPQSRNTRYRSSSNKY